MDKLKPLSGSYYAGKIETVMLVLVQALVDDDKAVTVLANTADGTSVQMRVTVAQKDVGKLIGKQGRNARALRTLLAAAGKKYGQRYLLDIAAAGSGEVIEVDAARVAEEPE